MRNTKDTVDPRTEESFIDYLIGFFDEAPPFDKLLPFTGPPPDSSPPDSANG